jgi:DNA-directed RNA polymerase beta subunit
MRVTTGLLLEAQFGTARALSPSLIKQYDTIFLSESNFNNKMKLYGKIMARFGLRYDSKSTMISGTTGRQIKCPIFTGLASMRTLRHRSKDKLRSRERGPINELTRQTTVGKKQGGGLKAGEMENWNWGAHGAPHMLQSINYDSADKSWITFCTRCQMPAIGCKETKFFFCKMCNSFDALVQLKIPAISNLMESEAFTASWGLTFQAEEVNQDTVFCGDKPANRNTRSFDEDAIYHNFMYNTMLDTKTK